jgi:hypothetical protein
LHQSQIIFHGALKLVIPERPNSIAPICSAQSDRSHLPHLLSAFIDAKLQYRLTVVRCDVLLSKNRQNVAALNGYYLRNLPAKF